MTGGSGIGTAGSPYMHYVYPGTYEAQDFHYCGLEPNNDIINYGNRLEVQTCQLVGLAEYVSSCLPWWLNTQSYYWKPCHGCWRLREGPFGWVRQWLALSRYWRIAIGCRQTWATFRMNFSAYMCSTRYFRYCFYWSRKHYLEIYCNSVYNTRGHLGSRGAHSAIGVCQDWYVWIVHVTWLDDVHLYLSQEMFKSILYSLLSQDNQFYRYL